MYTKDLPQSPSMPALHKTIVTDDNDQSDSSDLGGADYPHDEGHHEDVGHDHDHYDSQHHEGHEAPVDYAEYNIDLLHHGSHRPASPHEPSLDDVIRNDLHDHADHAQVDQNTQIAHIRSPTDDPMIFHPMGTKTIVSQETSLEDEGQKEDPSTLLHELPHNLEDPSIDDSPIRVAVHEQSMQCLICGNDTGKPLLRFHPVEHELFVSAAAPGVSTFILDISLHVFCGRTASILPNVNRPDLEILPKAGIKNKHGIGQEVNAALARTRCAVLTEAGSKEKSFYLVREFEANLAAVRNSFVQYHQQIDTTPIGLGNYLPVDTHAHQLMPQPQPQVIEQVEAFMDMQQEGMFEAEADSPPRKRAKSSAPHYPKQRCACGGSYSNPASWRTHLTTKRHQRWEEANPTRGA